MDIYLLIGETFSDDIIRWIWIFNCFQSSLLNWTINNSFSSDANQFNLLLTKGGKKSTVVC